MNGSRVEVDTSALEAGIRDLAVKLAATGPTVGGAQAGAIVANLRQMTPARSGRLRATIYADRSPVGASVHYGGDLPYASYIDGRTHASERATAGAAEKFVAAMYAAAYAIVRAI